METKIRPNIGAIISVIKIRLLLYTAVDVVQKSHTAFVWKRASEGFSRPQSETWSAASNCLSPSNLVVDSLIYLFCKEAPEKRTMHRV